MPCPAGHPKPCPPAVVPPSGRCSDAEQRLRGSPASEDFRPASFDDDCKEYTLRFAGSDSLFFETGNHGKERFLRGDCGIDASHRQEAELLRGEETHVRHTQSGSQEELTVYRKQAH